MQAWKRLTLRLLYSKGLDGVQATIIMPNCLHTLPHTSLSLYPLLLI